MAVYGLVYVRDFIIDTMFKPIIKSYKNKMTNILLEIAKGYYKNILRSYNDGLLVESVDGSISFISLSSLEATKDDLDKIDKLKKVIDYNEYNIKKIKWYFSYIHNKANNRDEVLYAIPENCRANLSGYMTNSVNMRNVLNKNIRDSECYAILESVNINKLLNL